MLFHSIIPSPTTVDSSILILKENLEANSISTISAVLHLTSTLYVSVFYSKDYSFDDELSLIYLSDVEYMDYLTDPLPPIPSKDDNLYHFVCAHSDIVDISNALCLYESS